MSPSRKSAPSAVIGLDIGTDSIKIVEAKRAKDGITITGLGIVRTPEGVIENEVIADPQALGNAIKALMADNGIKTKKCVSSVAGQSRVVIRVVEVPKMKPEELAETMKWQVETQVPFSPDDIVMDFQPLDRPNADPDAQNMEVLLAVAQQELIDNHVKMLLAAGLQPMAIDIEPLAASRSLIEMFAGGAKDEVIAIVNIGANNTDVGVFENGILTFPSPPLGIAGISFTREISEVLGQTLEQAEVTKREYAAVDLNGFGSPAMPDDQGASATVSEPTSFNTVIAPDVQFASAFDMDASPAAEPDDTADTNDFTNIFTSTEDATGDAMPASDTQDMMGAPTFDLGAFATETSGLSFDLGDSQPVDSGPTFDLGDSQPTDSGPTFDLGGEESPVAESPMFDLGGDDSFTNEAPPSPMFDLDDDDTSDQVQENLSAPSFDLNDTDSTAFVSESIFTQAPAAPAFQSGSMEDAVFQAISGVLMDLADELRRSLEYYSTRYSKLPQRIYLCGGTAKMPKLDEFLSRELGIPVEVADPVKNLRVKVPGVSDQYLKEISPLFSVSIGLAIRDMIG